MNTEPGEYKPDKPARQLPQVNQNPWAFSVSWTDKPNANGIRPPNPQFQPAPVVPYILPPTIVAGPTEFGSMPNGLIQSKREPYAVEFPNNGYGLLSTRLGTNLGV